MPRLKTDFYVFLKVYMLRFAIAKEIEGSLSEKRVNMKSQAKLVDVTLKPQFIAISLLWSIIYFFVLKSNLTKSN